MEGYIIEWLNLLGRWAHLVTGIAWIGEVFSRQLVIFLKQFLLVEAVVRM